MKFVLILAFLLAVAYTSNAAPAEEQPNIVQTELENALVEAGIDPDVAHGFFKKIGKAIKKAVPYVQKGLEIYGAMG